MFRRLRTKRTAHGEYKRWKKAKEAGLKCSYGFVREEGVVHYVGDFAQRLESNKVSIGFTVVNK